MPVETDSAGVPVQLYFLETGLQSGDRLFELAGSRLGVALRSEAGTPQVLRLVRDVAPVAEDRRPAAIHLLWFECGSDGEILRGEIPDGVEEIVLGGSLFRNIGEGGFCRVVAG